MWVARVGVARVGVYVCLAGTCACGAREGLAETVWVTFGSQSVWVAGMGYVWVVLARRLTWA